jgi:hypothetical protein
MLVETETYMDACKLLLRRIIIYQTLIWGL